MSTQTDIAFGDPSTLQERHVAAAEKLATQMERQASAADRMASLAGAPGAAMADRLEIMVRAVLASPRNLGTADDTLQGMVTLAAQLLAAIDAEVARQTAPPVTP